MKKYIVYFPNVISSVRVLFSLGMIFTNTFGIAFFILYALSGFSDMADGFIARRFNAESRLGAVLDSIGDFIFLLISAVKILPCVNIGLCIYITVILIAVLKIVSAVIGAIKYRSPVFLHTVANKIAGFLLYVSPAAFCLINNNIVGISLCLITGYAAVEELAINIISEEKDLNRRGLFIKQS